MQLSLCRASLFAALAAASLTAQIDRESDVRTDYQHLRHATIAEIATWTSQGYRLSNFEIAAHAPELTLNCSLVRNTGVYAATWFFHHDKTRAELANLCTQNNARPVDIERFTVGGEERLSALLFVNTGQQQKSWHWHTSIPQGSVYSTVNALGKRIIDLEPYVENGQQLYHAVSIANSGPDQKAWWVYTGTTRANIEGYMAQHDARLYDLELEDLLPTKLCCVLVRDDLRSLTLWANYYGSGFNDDVENGGRVVSLAHDNLAGHAVTLLDNMNPFTTTGVASVGTMGTTLQAGQGDAFTGTQVVYRCENLRPWAPAFIAYGIAPQSQSLAGFGAPGCWAYVVPIATELRFANGSGVATDTLNLPADPSYAGLPLLTQFVVSDPGINALGIQTSKRMQTLIRHW